MTGILVEQDAAHTETAGGNMFRSYTHDPAGHAVPVMNSWALANETVDSWDSTQDAVLDCYLNASVGEDDAQFTFANHPDTCYLSDGQKGLRSSQESKFPLSGTAACVQHFKADLITALGHKHSLVFDLLAYSTREDEFLRIWSEADPFLQRYLDKYPRGLWTKLWGHRAKKNRMASSVRSLTHSQRVTPSLLPPHHFL